MIWDGSGKDTIDKVRTKASVHSSGGVGLVIALRLGYWWWCRIGEFIAARASVMVKDRVVCWV